MTVHNLSFYRCPYDIFTHAVSTDVMLHFVNSILLSARLKMWAFHLL